MTFDNTTAPTPEAPAEPTLSAAESADARISAAVEAAPAADQASAPDATNATESTTGETQSGDDPYADVDWDNLTYRDAKALREELAKDRERWRPVQQSIGALSDQAREALLAVAPELGDELGVTAGIMATLDQSDRQAVLTALDAMVRGDRATAAQMFGQFQQALAGTQVPQVPAAEPQVPGQEAPGADQPLTQADVERLVEQRLMGMQQEAVTQQIQSQMLADLTSLGYDPNSDDPVMQARTAGLLTFAQMSGDLDLKAADEKYRQAIEDQIIENFVAARRADAQRTTPASELGTGPSPARELKTMQDATAAAEARLAAAFGNG